MIKLVKSFFTKVILRTYRVCDFGSPILFYHGKTTNMDQRLTRRR